MQSWRYILAISFAAVFYNYAGYALLALLWDSVTRGKRKKNPVPCPDDPLFHPSVSFIVAAYNEEAFVREKVRIFLGQDYPAASLEFIFITDGSTDRTPGIVGEYPSVRLLHQAERKGKAAAMNRAAAAARHDILIFSDANTTLNQHAVARIVRNYRDNEVGGVAGEKKVITGPGAPAAAGGAGGESGGGEGLYWKYESALKKIDSAFYSVVGAAGELFSLRKDLYMPLPENTILDDFVLSLTAAQKGYRIRYEPEAYAMELPSSSIKEEQKRKIRIAAGGFQAIAMLRSLFLFWRSPRLSYLYISHRVLRWTLSPLCLLLAFLSAAVLFAGTGDWLAGLCFGAQVAFYGMALVSCLPLRNRMIQKIFRIPYYFTFMNVSVIVGFFRFLKGSQSAVWEKARRTDPGIITE